MLEPLLLGVNIDHVATLRQARGTRYPEPLEAALAAEAAGADSITVHLREDRRHIQDRDVELLSQTLQTRMNLEMAATESMVVIAERVRPADCCLVPERRAELTTEGGLDVSSQVEHLTVICKRLAAAQIRVSLFIDPESEQVEAAACCAAPVVEFHTGCYASATNGNDCAQELQRIRSAAAHARKLGLRAHAGHGLHYGNVVSVAALPDITELNIGHAIVARALFSGFSRAVRDMKALITQARLLHTS